MLPITAMHDQLQVFMDQQAARDAFSGAVLLAQEDQVVFSQAYGLANMAFQAPNRTDTKFNLGSMNKMFTAVAILQLAEQGCLAVTDAVSVYLPEYPVEVARKITVHHLLTHSAGLGNYWNARYEAERATLRSVDAYLRLFADEPLLFEPGERVEYSNSGYIVLGAIIERVTGQPYADYVREHICAPAGMRDTDLFALDETVPNLAVGYTRVGDDGEPHTGPWRTNVLHLPARGGPAGGGYATVADLWRFATALRAHTLLGPEHTALLLANKVALQSRAFSGYGYGFGQATVNGCQIVGHSGGFPGINAHLDLYLDRGCTVVVLANYDPPAATTVASWLRERLAHA